MNRILAAASLFALVACSPAQLAGSLTSAPSPETIARLASVCQAIGPLLSASTTLALPAVIRETAIPADAYCAELAGGVLPKTTDGNTVGWLSRIVDVLTK